MSTFFPGSAIVEGLGTDELLGFGFGTLLDGLPVRFESGLDTLLMGGEVLSTFFSGSADDLLGA